MRCEEASSGFLGKSLLTFVLNKGVPGAAPVPLPAHKFSPHDVIAVRPNATGSGGTDAASSIAQGVAYRVHEDKIIVAVDDLDDSAALDVPLRLDKLANKVCPHQVTNAPISAATPAPQRAVNELMWLLMLDRIDMPGLSALESRTPAGQALTCVDGTFCKADVVHFTWA